MKAKGDCKTVVFTLVLFSNLFASAAAAAPVGNAFTYQGRLSDSSGPISGRYDFLFRLYSVPSGGSALINVTNLDVSVSHGVFTTAIDFGAAFAGDARWLEIRVRTNGSSAAFATLSPRQSLRATPSAHFATTAQTIPNSSIDAQKVSAGPAANGDVLAYSGGNLIWTNVVTQDSWKLLGNTGTTAGVHFLGTTDNQPLELMVNSQRVFRLAPTSNAPTIIRGFSGNFVTTQAVGITISGGGAPNINNFVDSVYYYISCDCDHMVPKFASIGGGAANRISGGEYATIAGGIGNWIGAYRAEEGHQNTIVGGGDNVVYMASYSTVTGGQGNKASGTSNYRVRHSTVGGGASNACDFAWEGNTVGGGSRNVVGRDVYFGTIKGGRNNLISLHDGYAGTIRGGSDNTVRGRSGMIGGGSGNVMNNFESSEVMIGGGIRNSIRGGDAVTISGGSSNSINGSYAVVPGGRENVAFDYCFAAGRRAKATNTGTFVWTDSSDFNVGSLATNEFCVRATGGVRLVTAIDDADAPATGASLTAGSGSWSSLSDRAVKENFVPVNATEILEKVVSLPLSTWNYKAQEKSIRHIGPTAQDFRAAFGVGENDRTISTIDADGVALAAIQGLNQKIEAGDARMCELEARLAALERASKHEAQSGDLDFVITENEKARGSMRKESHESKK